MRNFVISALMVSAVLLGCQGNTVYLYVTNEANGLSQLVASEDPERTRMAAETASSPSPSPAINRRSKELILPEDFTLPLVGSWKDWNGSLDRSLTSIVIYDNGSTGSLAIWSRGELKYWPDSCNLTEDVNITDTISNALTLTGFGIATDSAHISLSPIGGISGKPMRYTLTLHCRPVEPGEGSRNLTVRLQTLLSGNCSEISF